MLPVSYLSLIHICDLSKTEIINDKQFIEYTKNGYATTFTVTVVEPYKRWEFDMENSNMKGHWIGVFIDKGNETQIDLSLIHISVKSSVEIFDFLFKYYSREYDLSNLMSKQNFINMNLLLWFILIP